MTALHELTTTQALGLLLEAALKSGATEADGWAALVWADLTDHTELAAHMAAVVDMCHTANLIDSDYPHGWVEADDILHTLGVEG